MKIYNPTVFQAIKRGIIFLSCASLSFVAIPGNSIPDWLVSIDGVLWHKCSVGQKWDAGSNKCSGSIVQLSLMDSVAAISRANNDDQNWEYRLPWAHEIASIVDCGGKPTRSHAVLPGQSKEVPHWCEYGSKKPTLNESLFPDSVASFYWTQTKSKTNANGVDFYWGLNFEFGVLNDSVPVHARIASRLVAVRKEAISNSGPLPSKVPEEKSQSSKQSTHAPQNISQTVNSAERQEINSKGRSMTSSTNNCAKFSVGSTVKVPVAGYPKSFNGLVVGVRLTSINARILDVSAPQHLTQRVYTLGCR